MQLLQAVADRLVHMKCKRDQPIINMGTTSAGLFIVRAGECHCFIPDAVDSSKRKLVATILPGELQLVSYNL